jgi:hypothetical protein
MLIETSDERWDEIILVLSPQKLHERMLERPEYQASAQLRVAALQDSRLIAATAPDDWSDCLDALQADEPSPSVAP